MKVRFCYIRHDVSRPLRGVLRPAHFELNLNDNLLPWEVQKEGERYASEHYGLGRLVVIEDKPLPRILAG
ncbi:MAG: hypothetical protein UW07_C0001G0010 [Candidatus Nomurabacteria bacterium GW2011_GWF2_43_8]|nr:MAG: hypothetical protein UW02_C0014G0006 [Candidatus Nomurabacteria bacterium GW2011_GWB1_43_7]KKT25178.1 MAG: hypothetical protein UW07_C0001G0010 [Candidatus Nomurabacteria bacterium GW2011_GWF2_43_8]